MHTIRLRSQAEPHTYVGSVRVQDKTTLAVRGLAADVWLVGTFGDAPKTVDFRAKLTGDTLRLEAMGKTLAMKRRAEKTQDPGYTERPSAKVLNATFEFLQFQTGLLYDQPGFKMPAKHERAFKLKITKLWASLSAAQQRKMSNMPTAWSKLNGQWNALDDTQKQAFTKSYQKKWMDEITLKSRKATDSATREKYQKQLVDYLVMRKKIAQAKDSQARAARQAKRSKKRANKSHKFDPNAGLRMQTEMMQMDMLNQSYRNLQIARSWD